MCTQFLKELLTERHRFGLFMALALLWEAILGVAIILRVNYTEIDWVAYMQEVGGYLGGELDYTKLQGDTGPLVYPAGFVYLYSLLFKVTDQGANIRLAQYVFLGLYLALLAVVLLVYQRTRRVPTHWLLVLLLSYRIHSIFMLRLFNDCWAMLFMYMAVYAFQRDRWSIGCALFSLAVSIKMNVLLFAPGVGVLLLARFGFLRTLPKLGLCAFIQFALALPFLAENAPGYFSCAFNFGRQFMYRWTVNLKFLPEDVFLSKELAIGLLVAHVAVLLVFLNLNERRGLWGLVKTSIVPDARKREDIGKPLRPDRIVTTLFLSNFIGVVFARSLHYQFYVWYFHTLPYLLWLTPYWIPVKLLLLAGVEWSWNVYPARPISSACLWLCHGLILLGLFIALKRNRQQRGSWHRHQGVASPLHEHAE